MVDLSALWARLPAVLALLARCGGFFATAPVFSGRYIPVQVKACVVLYLSVALSPLIHVAQPDGSLALAGMMVVEALVGLATGFAASLVFVAVQVAGQIADTEMGFGMVNVLDPVHGSPIPLMGSFTYLLSLLLFLAIDGHHFLLSALIRSYQQIPGGQANVNPSVAGALVQRLAEAFGIGVQLAAPVLASLFLATVAMGIVARTVPQINVFMMGLPIKVLVGASVVSIGLPVFTSVALGVIRSSYSWVSQFIQLLAP